MELLAKLFSFLGNLGATAGSTACSWLFYDEPEMPKSLIK